MKFGLRLRPVENDDTRCPFCREALEGALRRCAGCRTQHHEACWSEHGGCSLLGCVREESAVSSAEVELVEVPFSWAQRARLHTRNAGVFLLFLLTLGMFTIGPVFIPEVHGDALRAWSRGSYWGFAQNVGWGLLLLVLCALAWAALWGVGQSCWRRANTISSLPSPLRLEPAIMEVRPTDRSAEVPIYRVELRSPRDPERSRQFETYQVPERLRKFAGRPAHFAVVREEGLLREIESYVLEVDGEVFLWTDYPRPESG